MLRLGVVEDVRCVEMNLGHLRSKMTGGLAKLRSRLILPGPLSKLQGDSPRMNKPGQDQELVMNLLPFTPPVPC